MLTAWHVHGGEMNELVINLALHMKSIIDHVLLFSFCCRPIRQHFIPTLDQLKFEIEDGYTPEGARVRYGYDERLFPDFSWRGYAILIPYQV